jgi:hypothetical protein
MSQREGIDLAAKLQGTVGVTGVSTTDNMVNFTWRR